MQKRITVTLEPFPAHTLSGSFRLGGGARVAGYCWKATPSKMQADGTFGPVAYTMNEFGEQEFDAGRVVKRFANKDAIIAHMEGELNAPPRELTSAEIARTPGSAAWCEGYGDNR